MSKQLLKRIERLKQERNAVILAHNYQPGEIQDLADFCGDSLGLSIKAAETEAEVIVFCGVKFMAETAAILSPEKTVLLPDKNAGCPMADMITAKQLVKLILWPGYCKTHIMITEDAIRAAELKYPEGVVLAHPECSEPVKALSDKLLSTGQMLDYVETSDARRFIVATETGIIHALKKRNPAAEYIAASEKAICPNMKRIALEKVLWSLEDMRYEIVVPEEIRVRAKRALDRMVETSATK